MTDKPLITCVIPTYRRPKMLARAIRSVLNQTFSRLRVFVTDNASGDETADIVRDIQSRDSRVIYHCQPENLGMNPNFVYGMSRVETPFFSNLSDDDVLLPEFYETAYSEFQKHPQAIFVATQVYDVTESGRLNTEPLSLWDRMGLFEPPTGAFRVASIAHPTLTGILFRREFLETPWAYLDPSIHAADYEIIFNAACNFPIVTVAKPGALFIQHSNPRARPADPFSKIYHAIDCIKRVDDDERFPDRIKTLNKERWINDIRGYLRGLTIRFFIDKKYDDAERALNILLNLMGDKDKKVMLRMVYQLVRTAPLLSDFLRQCHTIFTGLRDKIRDYQKHPLNSDLLNIMKL